MKTLLLALGALGLVGCTPKYVYHPEENATAQVAGHVAADYKIPPDAPKGDVRIASFGISQIKPENPTNTNEKVRALHLRMVVANNSQTTWHIDTRDQFIEIAGHGRSRPAYAWAHEGVLPVINVPPDGKAEVDLFYPLPADLQKENKLPQFDALWNVQTGQQLVTERTPFQRLRVEPAYAYGYGGFGPYYGWGPWWYDPLYPYGGFTHAVVLPQVYVTQPVYIARPNWRR